MELIDDAKKKLILYIDDVGVYGNILFWNESCQTIKEFDPSISTSPKTLYYSELLDKINKIIRVSNVILNERLFNDLIKGSIRTYSEKTINLYHSAKSAIQCLNFENIKSEMISYFTNNKISQDDVNALLVNFTSMNYNIYITLSKMYNYPIDYDIMYKLFMVTTDIKFTKEHLSKYSIDQKYNGLAQKYIKDKAGIECKNMVEYDLEKLLERNSKISNTAIITEDIINSMSSLKFSDGKYKYTGSELNPLLEKYLHVQSDVILNECVKNNVLGWNQMVKLQYGNLQTSSTSYNDFDVISQFERELNKDLENSTDYYETVCGPKTIVDGYIMRVLFDLNYRRAKINAGNHILLNEFLVTAFANCRETAHALMLELQLKYNTFIVDKAEIVINVKIIIKNFLYTLSDKSIAPITLKIFSLKNLKID